MPGASNANSASSALIVSGFSVLANLHLGFEAPSPSRGRGASVTFEPGARSAWHTHPLGQVLIVTTGVGVTQCCGEAPVKILPGDVISCPPGRKHWHGASPTTAMTHIAIQEALDGKVVDWLEKVSDEEYHAAAAKAE
jgi:quercetin dioxygenase-like cupin family protein